MTVSRGATDALPSPLEVPEEVPRHVDDVAAEMGATAA